MASAEERYKPLLPYKGTGLAWNSVPIRTPCLNKFFGMDNFFYDRAARAVDMPEWDGHTVGPAMPVAILAYKMWFALLIVVPIIGYLSASTAAEATEYSTNTSYINTEPSIRGGASRAAEYDGTASRDSSLDSDDKLLQVPQQVVVSVYIAVSTILLIMEHKIRRFSIIPQLLVLEQFPLPVPLPCCPNWPSFYQWLAYVSCMSVISYMDLLNKSFCLGVVLKSSTYGLWAKLLFFAGYVTVFAQWVYAYGFSMPEYPANEKYTLREKCDSARLNYQTRFVEIQDNGRALQALARTSRMISVCDKHHTYAASIGCKAPEHLLLEELRQANWWFILFFVHRCAWLGLQSYTLVGADSGKDAQNVFFLGMSVTLSLINMASAWKTCSTYWEKVDDAIKNISGGLPPMELTHAEAGSPDQIFDKFEEHCRRKSNNPKHRTDGGHTKVTTATGRKFKSCLRKKLSELQPVDYPITVVYEEGESLQWRKDEVKKCKLTLKVSLFVEALFVIAAFLVVLRAVTKRHESEILNSVPFKILCILGLQICGIAIMGLTASLQICAKALCRSRPRSSE